MILKREKGNAIQDPSAKKLKTELLILKRYGPSSYATLSAGDGSYIQVAGGGVTCLLEKRDQDGKHYRAWQEKPVVPPDFKDGSLLCFSGGEVPMLRNEWFNIHQVIEAFTAFRELKPLPDFIKWRDITALLTGSKPYPEGDS